MIFERPGGPTQASPNTLTSATKLLGAVHAFSSTAFHADAMRYRLRTLLIVVTASGILIGCLMSRIRERQAFIAKQLELNEAACVIDGDDVEQARLTKWWKNQLSPDSHAPQPLWLLGDSSINKLYVVVPEKDVIRSIGKVCWLHDLPEFKIRSSQPDYRRAKRLFPEAKVTPIMWSDDPSGAPQRVCLQLEVLN